MKKDDRKFKILQAIVADYVDLNEPVGSKTISQRYDLNVSSATVRKDMSELEDEGYILAPHKSAGRIPTDKGYRAFVDAISEVKPLSTPEKHAIRRFLTETNDLDSILKKAVQILSNLTHQVAVVQYPILSASKILHLELIRQLDNRILLVIIADTGRIEKQNIRLQNPIDEEIISKIKDILNKNFANKEFSTIVKIFESIDKQNTFSYFEIWDQIEIILKNLALENIDSKMVIGGTGNLAKNIQDFESVNEILGILDELEEQVVLLKMLSLSAYEQSNSNQFNVKIGSENQNKNFKPVSFVTSNYGDNLTRYGTIGIIGPTRMDYSGTISRVSGIAKYISEILFDKN